MSGKLTEFERAAQALRDQPVILSLNVISREINEVLHEILKEMGVRLFDLDTITKGEAANIFSMVVLHFSLEKITEVVALDYLENLRTLITEVLIRVASLGSASLKDDYRHLAYSTSLLGRALAYHAQNKPMLVLSRPNFNRDTRGVRGSRQYPCVSARMLWLEQRTASKMEVYPEEGRYA
jgi:hypothetical protein